MASLSKFDPDFTQKVIDASGPEANPRIRQLVNSLVQHTHDYLRENEVTREEWAVGLEFLNSLGKSSEKRNMTSQAFGLFGTEILLDEIAIKCGNGLNIEGTPSSVLGPLFRDGAPVRENDSFIFTGVDDAEVTYMHGTVFDQITKKPIAGAWIDVWQASTNGLYENQDENQEDYNLRAKFKTDDNGHYSFYCLRPPCYPVKIEGPCGKLLDLLDRPKVRPSHIHLKVQCEGYKLLITQVYDSKDPYIKRDVVLAVKDKLTLEYKPLEGNPKAKLELEFPIFLVPNNTECSQSNEKLL